MKSEEKTKLEHTDEVEFDEDVNYGCFKRTFLMKNSYEPLNISPKRELTERILRRLPEIVIVSILLTFCLVFLLVLLSKNGVNKSEAVIKDNITNDHILPLLSSNLTEPTSEDAQEPIGNAINLYTPSKGKNAPFSNIINTFKYLATFYINSNKYLRDNFENADLNADTLFDRLRRIISFATGIAKIGLKKYLIRTEKMLVQVEKWFDEKLIIFRDLDYKIQLAKRVLCYLDEMEDKTKYLRKVLN